MVLCDQLSFVNKDKGNILMVLHFSSKSLSPAFPYFFSLGYSKLMSVGKISSLPSSIVK